MYLGLLLISGGKAEKGGRLWGTLYNERRKSSCVPFNRLTDLSLNRIELHVTDNALLLFSNTDEAAPLLCMINPITNNLRSSQVLMTSKNLDRLCIICTVVRKKLRSYFLTELTIHRPMVDGGSADKSQLWIRNPFPKLDRFCRGTIVQLCFLCEIIYLQLLCIWTSRSGKRT